MSLCRALSHTDITAHRSHTGLTRQTGPGSRRRTLCVLETISTSSRVVPSQHCAHNGLLDLFSLSLNNGRLFAFILKATVTASAPHCLTITTQSHDDPRESSQSTLHSALILALSSPHIHKKRLLLWLPIACRGQSSRFV